MKQNKIEKHNRSKVIAALSAVLVTGVVVGLFAGVRTLRAIWLEQCVIRDVDAQVEISAGRMVKQDVLAENLGLIRGANLALIDFAAKREETLRRIPNLRTITISRRMPDKVKVTAEERLPIAQVGFHGRKGTTGKVADAEGMVFICQRGTQMLPVIREAQFPGTTAGHVLTGRPYAALQVIEQCRNPEFQDLGLLEVDVSRRDFVMATLGNYSRAKIAWNDMGENTASSRKSLHRQLTLLAKAIRSRIGEGAMVWNATDTSSPGRIYADGQGNL